MLSIYLGDMPEAIYHPPTYFDNMYEDEWLTNPLSVEMIADVDKSTVIGTHLIEKRPCVLPKTQRRFFNPVLKVFTTTEPSGDRISTVCFCVVS